ncbi:hypothetical protein MP228_012644 [Amoeboaphelidium protococcarum]|nr:hypothetical protein MP228_012644 [Amoeboaphelidium protococcarum]
MQLTRSIWLISVMLFQVSALLQPVDSSSQVQTTTSSQKTSQAQVTTSQSGTVSGSPTVTTISQADKGNFTSTVLQSTQEYVVSSSTMQTVVPVSTVLPKNNTFVPTYTFGGGSQVYTNAAAMLSIVACIAFML